MKKIVLFATIVIILVAFSLGCTQGNNNSQNNENDSVRINGDMEMTVNVNSEFVDPGVTASNEYKIIVEGSVDTSIIGQQKIKYYVYKNTGELIKELHRYINVADLTAPTYTESENVRNKKYYAGVIYRVSDFILDYSDNYDSKNDISCSIEEIVFPDSGEQVVSINFEDKSGNKCTYSRTINVSSDIDFETLIQEAYKDSPYSISTGTNGIGRKYITITIDNGNNFTYYDNGSLHFVKSVSTQLGKDASIQISAKYGEFNAADITYHINGNGQDYSVGFATIDATRTDAYAFVFDSTINNLALNKNKMLDELNANLESVLKDFHDYMNKSLHLKVK